MNSQRAAKAHEDNAKCPLKAAVLLDQRVVSIFTHGGRLKALLDHLGQYPGPGLIASGF